MLLIIPTIARVASLGSMSGHTQPLVLAFGDQLAQHAVVAIAFAHDLVAPVIAQRPEVVQEDAHPLGMIGLNFASVDTNARIF